MIGDVSGQSGMGALFLGLSSAKRQYKADFVILNGENAKTEYTGISFAGGGQNLDNGFKVVHNAPNTSSVVNAKSISKNGGKCTYRSLVRINENAINSKSSVSCESLMLDDISSDTIIKLNECTIFKLKTNEKYLQKKNNTHFGKLVENTSFYEYAYNNSWALGTANINYIDSSLVKYTDKKNDFCLYFGGNIYYKISYLNKYSCNTFIYLDTKKSNQTYTPYTNYANKKIQFLPYSDYINTLHNLENDFKNNSLKFDSTKSYNRFIPFITTQLKVEI